MGTHQQVIELNEAGAAQDLVAALRARSYACVRLPQAASEAVGRLLQCGPEFFSAPDKPVSPSSTKRFHWIRRVPGAEAVSSG